MDISDKLKINIKDCPQNSSVKIVELIGSLDAITLRHANSVILPIIDEGTINIIANCRDLRYINSTALGGFMEYHKRTRKIGGNFKLAEVNPDVKKIIDVTGANRFLPIFPTVEEAVNSFIVNKDEKDKSSID